MYFRRFGYYYISKLRNTRHAFSETSGRSHVADVACSFPCSLPYHLTTHDGPVPCPATCHLRAARLASKKSKHPPWLKHHRTPNPRRHRKARKAANGFNRMQTRMRASTRRARRTNPRQPTQATTPLSPRDSRTRAKGGRRQRRRGRRGANGASARRSHRAYVLTYPTPSFPFFYSKTATQCAAEDATEDAKGVPTKLTP